MTHYKVCSMLYWDETYALISLQPQYVASRYPMCYNKLSGPGELAKFQNTNHQVR